MSSESSETMSFSLEDRCLVRAAMILFGMSVLAFIALEMVKLLTGYLQMRANLTSLQYQLDGMQKAVRRMTHAMTRLEDVIYLNLDGEENPDMEQIEGAEDEIVEVVDDDEQEPVDVKPEKDDLAVHNRKSRDSGTDVTSYDLLATISDPKDLDLLSSLKREPL